MGFLLTPENCLMEDNLAWGKQGDRGLPCIQCSTHPSRENGEPIRQPPRQQRDIKWENARHIATSITPASGGDVISLPLNALDTPLNIHHPSHTLHQRTDCCSTPCAP
ncbi:hypothetical protein JZ751_004853, partial [Albula glossodonta]